MEMLAFLIGIKLLASSEMNDLLIVEGGQGCERITHAIIIVDEQNTFTTNLYQHQLEMCVTLKHISVKLAFFAQTHLDL